MEVCKLNEENNQTGIAESIILTDNDGNDLQFDIMDVLEYKGSVYYVLLPADEIGTDTEYVILREIKDNESGETLLEGFDDAELLEAVFSEYKKRHVTV